MPRRNRVKLGRSVLAEPRRRTATNRHTLRAFGFVLAAFVAVGTIIAPLAPADARAVTTEDVTTEDVTPATTEEGAPITLDDVAPGNSEEPPADAPAETAPLVVEEPAGAEAVPEEVAVGPVLDPSHSAEPGPSVFTVAPYAATPRALGDGSEARFKTPWIMKPGRNHGYYWPMRTWGVGCPMGNDHFNVCYESSQASAAEAAAYAEVWSFPEAGAIGLVKRESDGACLLHPTAAGHKNGDYSRILPGSRAECNPKLPGSLSHSLWTFDAGYYALRAVEGTQPSGFWLGFESWMGNSEEPISKNGRMTDNSGSIRPLSMWNLHTGLKTPVVPPVVVPPVVEPPVVVPPVTVDYSKSKLTIAENLRFANKSDHHVALVTVIGSDGKVMKDQTVDFTVYNPGGVGTADNAFIEGKAAHTSFSRKSDANGLAAVVVRADKIGNYPVEAKIGATGVSGSKVRTADFVEAVSTLSVTQPAVPADGVATQTATATVKTNTGVPLSGRSVTFGLFNPANTGGTTSALLEHPITSTTDENGVATVRITAKVAGKYPVGLKIGTVDSPATRTVTADFYTPIIPTRILTAVHKVTPVGYPSGMFAGGPTGSAFTYAITVTNSGNTATAATTILQFNIPAGLTLLEATTAKGYFSSQVPGKWFVQALAPGASATGYVTVRADAAGSYVSKISSLTDSDTGTVGCTSVDQPACGPNRTVTITDPITVGSSTLAVTSGTRHSNTTQTHQATATIYNNTGALMGGQNIKFSIHAADGGPTTDATLDLSAVSTGTSGASLGKAVVNIKATKPGKYMVRATYGADLPVGTGFGIVEFVDVSAAKSEFTVSTGSQEIVTGRHTATATVRDNTGAVMADQLVNFTIFNANGSAASGVTITPAMTSGAGGVAVANITATKAGTYLVKATVGGASIPWVVNQLALFADPPTTGDLTISHYATESEVEVGDTFDYVLTVTNGTTGTTRNATAVFDMLKFASKNPAGAPTATRIVSYFSHDLSGYSKTTGLWNINDASRLTLAPGQSMTLTVTAKAAAPGTVASQVTSLAAPDLSVNSCSTGAQAACGQIQTVKVVAAVPLLVDCPATPSETGLVKLSGKSVPLEAAKVLVYVRAGLGAPTLFGEASLVGAGATRTWTYQNLTALGQGQYTFSVRSVNAAGVESADAAVSCPFVVAKPIDITGAKQIEDVANQSIWIPAGDPASWEITATNGGQTQVLNAGSAGKLEVGKSYEIGERLVAPVPAGSSALYYTQKGGTVCVDSAKVPLPLTIFNPLTGILTPDVTGANPVAGPVSCTIVNQAANVAFVTKHAGGQTQAPTADWKLAFTNAENQYSVLLDGVGKPLAEARPGSYDIAASAPQGALVTGIDRLNVNIPGCRIAEQTTPGSAPALCWQPASDSEFLAAENVPQGFQSVYRINYSTTVEVPDLPFTGGVGSWQFLASGGAVLLLASTAYWRRARSLSVIPGRTRA